MTARLSLSLRALVSVCLATLLATPARLAWAETALTLQALLDSTAATHPLMQSSKLNARAADQDVDATQRQRWPSVSVSVETNTGNPYSSPSRALAVEQTLWDAGRVSLRVDEARTLADASRTRIQMQRLDLFLQVTNAWQNLLAARGRLAVAQETLARLDGYQAQMERRVRAEASPRIDLELVDSRIRQTQVERNVAQASLNLAAAKLEQLSGLTGLAARASQGGALPDLQDTESAATALGTLDLALAAMDQPSVALARHEVSVAKTRLDYKEAEKWPQAYLRVYKPLSSNVPGAYTGATAFVGLRYAPGAGFAQFTEAQALATRVASAEQTIDAALRTELNTLQNDREEFFSARSRMQAVESAVAGSAAVLESYLRQFQGGRKTWQDLLNAARELAQSQYAEVDARASMAGAMYRLQIRLGEALAQPWKAP